MRETSAENERIYSNTHPQEAWHTLMTEWFKPYGKPRRIRSDPEGSYRSAMLQQNAIDHDIVWETTASQAHWMTGKVERAIGLIKHTMSKMATEDPSLSHDELFTWSVVAHNELIREDGWSPDQTTLGRQPRPLDLTLNPLGLLQTKSANMRGHISEKANLIRLLSQTSYLSAQAIRRERIARQSQHRRTSSWSRGNLVCYWRQPGTQHSDIVNVGKGGFVGPAVVLGQDQGWKDGEIQARIRIWLLHGNRVVVVTPSHLRAATDTQKILHQVEGED